MLQLAFAAAVIGGAIGYVFGRASKNDNGGNDNDQQKEATRNMLRLRKDKGPK